MLQCISIIEKLTKQSKLIFLSLSHYHEGLNPSAINKSIYKQFPFLNFSSHWKMEHVTVNNETKWASSFIPYSKFILYRKLVTDHSNHSLGSKVVIPRISGWKVPFGSIHISKSLSFHLDMLRENRNNPAVLCVTVARPLSVPKLPETLLQTMGATFTFTAFRHGRASPAT